MSCSWIKKELLKEKESVREKKMLRNDDKSLSIYIFFGCIYITWCDDDDDEKEKLIISKWVNINQWQDMEWKEMKRATSKCMRWKFLK